MKASGSFGLRACTAFAAVMGVLGDVTLDGGTWTHTVQSAGRGDFVCCAFAA